MFVVELDDAANETVRDADDRVESDIVVAPVGYRNDQEESVEERAALLQPVRHYRHSPNSHLNTVLSSVALTALGFAIGIAIGHWFGKFIAHLEDCFSLLPIIVSNFLSHNFFLNFFCHRWY